jgi:hypothetical protein
MPELKWKEYEFIECLVVSIWQYDCLFEISLYQTSKEDSFISFHLSVRDKVVFVNDKRGSYLRFQDCSIISSNLPLTESANFYNGKSSENLIMSLEVDPQIKILFTS